MVVASNMRDASTIESDITVYGATSFVAKHVLDYLLVVSNTSQCDRRLRLTLGGRNQAKLDAVLNSLKENPKFEEVSVDVFVADGSDTVKLKEMASRTHVVLTCAGPYAAYGSRLVEACATVGTDYVDLTGETSWAGEMRLKHGPVAAKSGARIISFCGFDSVPSDLAIFAAVQSLREQRSGQKLNIIDGTTWHAAVGGINGGTCQTIANVPVDLFQCLFFKTEKSLKLRKVPFFVEDPLILTHPTETRLNPDMEETRNKMALSEWLNQLFRVETIFGLGISIPFFMAVANAKVVNASAVALGYGSGFSYRERHLPLGFGVTSYLGFLSIVPALSCFVAFMLLAGALRMPILGPFLLKWVIPPGSCAGGALNEKGHCAVYAQVTAIPPEGAGVPGSFDRANCYLGFQGDPGNLTTAQCICESALSLLLHREELPKRSSDGFGTPAELLGPVLLKRLKENQVRPVTFTTQARKEVFKSDWRMYR